MAKWIRQQTSNLSIAGSSPARRAKTDNINPMYIDNDPEFQNIIDRFVDGIPASIDCKYGWANLVRECDEVVFANDPNYTVSQIKEKLGGLRFYFNLSNMDDYARVSGLVMSIEERSFSTCEDCGEPGYRRRVGDYGRIYTACDAHVVEDI